MPITVVVGGQYGSEGKGKVAHWLARKQKAQYAVRVGGPNSGHTVVSDHCQTILRHLPTPVLHDDVVGAIPSGAYLDVSILLAEIEEVGLSNDRLLIDPYAVVIDDAMRAAERNAGLLDRIASTGQGVGSAVVTRTMRTSSITFAGELKCLRPFICDDLDRVLSDALARQERVILEGTQGFGLSILHGRHYPYATSRDTTAAGTLSEASLSPRDVDCVSLVLRAFPIRVAGNSGPLPLETTWQDVTQCSGANVDLTEFTTVTGRARRVAYFHSGVAIRALRANRPDLVVLNHVDYFDYTIHGKSEISRTSSAQIQGIEDQLDARIHHVGTGPDHFFDRPRDGWRADVKCQLDVVPRRTYAFRPSRA